MGFGVQGEKSLASKWLSLHLVTLSLASFAEAIHRLLLCAYTPRFCLNK
jgi:hypothetical protein